MKKILIIGATSSIAEHCARLWVARGDSLFIVARDAERLEVIAADLKLRGDTDVLSHCMDMNNLEEHGAMLDTAEFKLNGIDTVLIAYGTLPNQNICEQDVAKTIEEIKTNALSIIALLTLLANRFEEKRAGTIAIISSVAGDRGRASNYVYGSAKSMVTTFTSGLRQRLHKSNVNVVTIKPGFVDTPMTKGIKKGLLWAKPNVVSKKIIEAIDSQRKVVYVPGFWFVIMMIIKIIPEIIFVKINRL